MSRILIDGRFVGVGESMSRYTLELLSHILEIDKENEYTLLIRPAGEETIEKSEIRNPKSETNSKFPNLKFKTLDIPHYSLGEQTKLLKYLNREKFDLVHFPQFNHPVRYKGKYVVTIHDLILLNHAKAGLLKRLAFLPVLKSAVRDSVAIITASEETKREIVYTLKGDEKKISLIHHGIDHNKFNITAKSHRTELDDFCRKNKIDHDYLLYVGAWKSHKNVSRMLESYEKYLQENEKFVHLVLVGRVDKKEKAILAKIDSINKSQTPNSELRTPIIAAGPVSDDRQLAAVYGGAIAYVMPSLAEGFGWPPLEAMACGTPVISSKVSCMPEILGDAVHYFDPLNVDDMAAAMAKIIQDHTLRENLIKKGLEQAKKYNWDETAERTLEVYKEILN
ncbi:MAG: glycosyltransferase family 1 protein [bacterium]|nr:glycosyltransferase family 1 protein [bacterium]